MSEVWEEGAWRVLADELDRWGSLGRTAGVWWRDDDAGRADPALDRLLRLAAAHGVPLGLAVVPAWLDGETAATVREAPEQVVVLQHGVGHVNHETAIREGERKVRPAECGWARPSRQVLDEAAAAAAPLRAAFGDRFLPVFVPPWNRIAPEVVAGLPLAGYRVLSTFRPRPRSEAVPGLRQVNCHVDPILWREGKRFAGAAALLEGIMAHLSARREGQADPGEPTGLLTHHQVMGEACWEFLGELLGRLREHPAVSFPALPGLLQDG